MVQIIPNANAFQMLSSIGQNLAQASQMAQQREMLSKLGQSIQGGDYGGAAQAALAGGDINTGLQLLQMQNQRSADANAMSLLGQGQGQVTPQAGPMNLTGGMPANDEISGYITEAARKRGIDPNIALRVYASEGRGGYVGDSNSSFGPFQLHYGGRAPGGNAVSGLGDVFTKTTGLDARDPSTWRQQVDFSLDQAAKGGWTPWHGWKGDQWAGINRGQQPVQVADASGRVPIGGAPSAPAPMQQGGDASRLENRRNNIMRALEQYPNMSSGMAQRLRFEVQEIDRQLGRSDQLQARQDQQAFQRDERAAREQFQREQMRASQEFQRAQQAERMQAQNEKITGEQANAATFATRMAEADKILSDPAVYGSGMGFSGAAKNVASGIPVVGNMIVGSTQGGAEFQRYDQAQRDFVNAVLRKESGAAISSGEFDNARKQYFPQPGDTPAVIAQKAANRATAIDTIAAGGAPSFKKEFSAKRQGKSQVSPAAVLDDARAAIQRGAPREAVIQRLRENGVNVPDNF